MGRKLKQIKRDDLGESGKKVIDSLIGDKSKTVQKEESHEQMRCKIEIFEGSVKNILVDSYTVNTTSLSKTMDDILTKYGDNTQFKITNLYDEKVVAKRMVYTGGYDKDKVDREHFSKQMELARKIFKCKEEGKTEEEVCNKFASYTARSCIRKIYNSAEEELKLKLRKDYDNNTLGKGDQPEILSNDINTNKDIIKEEENDE